MPALLRPVDLPEDADGRVAVITVPPAPEELTAAGTGSAAGPRASRRIGGVILDLIARLDSRAGGWAAVGLLAVVLLAIFGIGMALTR